jgi:hypothetical protein
MDAVHPSLHARFAAVFEWLVAALFLSATIAVGALILRELNVPRPAASRPAPEPVAVPTSTPAGAASVPVLSLPNGVQVKIGDSLSAVADRLGRAAESAPPQIDRGAAGERVTRFYEVAGTRFILVFEAPQPGAELGVTAIFVQ